MNSTTIANFYAGKNVFITGGTGFLGKVFIEKLLRSCPDIGTIYILIREKKGKSIHDRLNKLLKNPLYDCLKSNHASQLKKIQPILGDCKELLLGLSQSDYQLLIENVSIILHVAASVRFDDPLEKAILLNTRGTREVAELALKTVNLKLLVHVSTTFCNCIIQDQIDEKFYPPPMDWREAIEVAEKFDPKTFVYLTDKYLGPYPNTYTFTKILGEYVIKDLCEGKIPTLISRPSVVISTYQEPIRGWIDNFNGPVGLLVACGKGLLRQSYQNPDTVADYIPVDTVVKATIVAGWDLGLKQQKSQVEIIHCNSNYHKWITLGEIIRFGRDMSAEYPLNDIIWVPKGFVTKCKYWAYICTILFHLVPALFLDLCLFIAGKKPMIARLQSKIYNASVQLRYFTWRQWNFNNQSFRKNLDIILDDDQKDWNYDISGIDFLEFLTVCLIGARKYLLNESDESIPRAKIHYKRMYWLDKFTMFLLYSSMVWLIFHFQLIERISNAVSDSILYLNSG